MNAGRRTSHGRPSHAVSRSCEAAIPRQLFSLVATPPKLVPTSWPGRSAWSTTVTNGKMDDALFSRLAFSRLAFSHLAMPRVPGLRRRPCLSRPALGAGPPTLVGLAVCGVILSPFPVFAQQARPGLPFAPIGSPSQVDSFVDPADRSSARGPRRTNVQRTSRMPAATNDGYPVRQVAMQSGGFAMPSIDNPPPRSSSPQLQPAPLLSSPPVGRDSSSPPSGQGGAFSSPPPGPARSLQPENRSGSRSNPAAGNTLRPTGPSAVSGTQSSPLDRRTLPAPSPSGTGQGRMSDPAALDYQPVPPPQLHNGGYATMADCRLITPPSGYTARSPYGGCGSAVPAPYAPAAYTPPPAQIPAPAAMPPLNTDQTPAVTYPTAPATAPPTIFAPPAAAPAGSLVSLGQETYQVQVGRGLWGQPVAYVPGQRFRNWLRYLSF